MLSLHVVPLHYRVRLQSSRIQLSDESGKQLRTAADFQKQVLHGKEYEKAFPPSTHCDAPVDIQIQFFLQRL